MTKLSFLLLCLLIGQAVAQTTSTTKLTPAQVATLSQKYQQRALWFRDMPQFNRDSTVLYFNKAVAVLEANPPLQYKRLAEVFLDITNRQNRSHPFTAVDSLAAKGWNYYQQVPANEQDKLLEYGLLNNWAFIKIEKGELKRAIALLSQALPLIENNPSPPVRVRYWRDKGRFLIRYGLPEDEPSGYALLKKSLNLAKTLPQQSNDDSMMILFKMLLGYYSETTPDSSIYCFNQIKALVNDTKNPFHHGWYHATWGNYLVEHGQYAEARAELMQAKTLLEKYRMQNVDSYTYTLSILGDLALKARQFDKAIAYYQQKRAITEANQFKEQSVGTLQLLSDAYEQKGDLRQALASERQYNQEALRLEKERAERSLREGELEMDVLKREKELEQKQTEQKGFIIALVIGLALLGLLYRNYRLKQRANLQLETLNAELDTKNKLLDKRNAENELLLKEIHHRVKNNLEVVSSLLALQSAKITDPNVQEAMRSSQNRVQSMGIIHQKLYQGEQLAAIEMRDYFINLGENILDSFDATGRVKIDCSMPELVLDIDTAISVGLITNELLTNSLKYAFVGKDTGTISVSLTRGSPSGPNNDSFLLQVADNGIGKILGESAKGTGFGTQLIDLLTRQLDGVLTYENQNGTLVKLRFREQLIA
jgi:two-component system, sensor histidine kinase PdtaS